MFGGYWRAGIALGLVLLVGIGVTQADDNPRVTYNKTVLECVPEGCFIVKFVPTPRLKPQTHSNNNSSENDDDTHPANTQPKPTPKAITPINDVVSSNNISIDPITQREEYKTDENRTPRQLLWFYPDEWLVIFTFALTVSTIGLWIASRTQNGTMRNTLAQMRKDSEDRELQFGEEIAAIRRSADAAEVSAEATLFISKENRPWLAFTMHNHVVTLNNTIDDSQFILRLTIKNVGRSPAIVSKSIAMPKVEEDISLEPQDVDFGDTDPPERLGIIPQGGEIDLAPCIFNLSDFLATAPQNQSKRLFILYKLIYTDPNQPLEGRTEAIIEIHLISSSDDTMRLIRHSPEMLPRVFRVKNMYTRYLD